MSYALVSMAHGMRHVVMTRDLKKRGNQYQCRVMGIMQEVRLEGLHDDPSILIEYGVSDAVANGTRSLYIKLLKMQLEPPMSPINQLKMQHSPPVSPIKGPSSIVLQPKKLFEVEDEQQLRNDFFLLNIEGIEQITEGIPNLLGEDDSISDDVYRPISGRIRPITGLISPPLSMKEIVVAPRNSPPILVRFGTSIPLVGESAIVQPAITQPAITQTTTTQPKKTRICCNKPNACKFCGEKRTNIKRHMLCKHREEPDVREYMSLPENHPRKKYILSQIRRDGNFSAFKKNDIIVSRLPSDNSNVIPTDYLVCACCKKVLKKRSLASHLKKCINKTTADSSRSIRLASLAMSEDIHPAASGVVKTNIFPNLRNGPVRETIRYDKLLIMYANDLCMKYRSQHHYPMIRNRISTLASVLINIRDKDSSVKEMIDLMNPGQFENIIKVLNDLGKYNETTGNYEKPSLPTTIGTSLRYVIRLHITECIKDSDSKGEKSAKNLLELINTLLPARINKTATESLLKRKRTKPVVMPSMEDIQKLTEYVEQNRQKYMEILQNGFSKEAWIKLVRFTIISILIFNRRRPGELQRAEINDLKSIQELDSDSELVSDLTEEEKQRVTQYARFVIRGKLARGVPVLLHKSMHQCITMILNYRVVAGVAKDNPYIFGIPQSEKSNVFRHVLATDLMREFSVACGAKNPKSLRATNLRKHVATHSMTLNLQNEDIENLQSYMGHADKIHKEYYRQPLIHKDIVNMSKVLLSAQGRDNTLGRVSRTQEVYTHAMGDQSTSGITVPSISGCNIPSTSGLNVPSSANSPHSSSCDSPPSPRRNNPLGSHILPSDVSPYGPESSDSDYIPNISDEDDLETTTKRRRLYAGKRGLATIKRTWTTPERYAIKRVFSSNFENQQPPSFHQIRLAITDCTELKARTIPQIRLWISNEINNLKNPMKRKSWATPVKCALKKAFGNYISDVHKGYPSSDIIRKKIREFKELRDKTPRKIRSQIQHQRNKLLSK